jgi:hypothetical protein
MKKLLIIFLGLLLTTLLATPSLSGPTGLITIPTAEALSYKEFNLGFDYLYSKVSEDNDDWLYKLNLGTFENWELGIVGGQVPTEGVFLNVKYYLMSDDSTQPLSFAIGSEKLTSESDTSVYMIASKKLRPDLGFHFGFRAIFGNDALDPSFMTGVNYVLSDILELMTDINGQEDKYTINIGAELFILRDLAIRASITDIAQFYKNDTDDVDGVGSQIGIGITYTKFL